MVLILPLRLAFIGRSTFIKGMHVLAEAVQQLPQDFPCSRYFFSHSSSWEQTEYGRELQHQLENDHRFEVKYNLPNDQLLKVLSGFDLCVVPSLWLETGLWLYLNLLLLVYLCLVAGWGGIAELVRDGVDGLLFEPGNSAELANIIQRLVNNPKHLELLHKGVNPPRNLDAGYKRYPYSLQTTSRCLCGVNLNSAIRSFNAWYSQIFKAGNAQMADFSRSSLSYTEHASRKVFLATPLISFAWKL